MPTKTMLQLQVELEAAQRRIAELEYALSEVASQSTHQKNEETLPVIGAFENCAHGIAIGLPTNKILTCNSAFARLQMRSIQEISGMPILSMYAEEERLQIQQAVMQSDLSGSARFEARMLRKDGSTYLAQMDVVSVKNESGELLYRVATQQDITERRRASEATRMLTERLDLATSAAKIGIWDWDIQKNELVWDDRMYKLYGLKSGEFPRAYEAWLNGLHPDDRESSNQVSQQAVRGEREYDTEFRVVWPDGSAHWLKAYGQVSWDENGIAQRMVGVNYDITEQKQADVALRQSEIRFRALIENAPGGVTLVGADGNFSFVSASAQHVMGYRPEDMLGLSPAELTHPDDLPELLGLLNNALQHPGKVITTQYRFRHKDGSWRWVESAVSNLFNEPSVNGFAFNFQDITERKQAQAALSASEEKYSVLFDKAAIPASLTKMPEVTFVDVNDAFEKIFGYTREEVFGKTSLELGIARPQEHARTVAAVEKHGVAFDDEKHIYTKSGEARVVLVNVSAVEFGGQRYTVSTIYDITERKHAEEALRRRTEELEQLLDVLPEVVWIAEDAECKLIHGNRFANQLLGVPEDANVSQTAAASSVKLRQFSQGKELAPDELPMQMAARTGLPQLDFELHIERPAQVTRILLGGAIPLFAADGNTRGAVATFHDITERKRAEIALRRSEENFSKAFRSSPAALLITRLADGQFMEVNSAYCGVVGYDRAELIGHLSTEFNIYINSTDRQAIVEQLKAAGSVRDFEVSIRHRSGAIRHVLAAQELTTFSDEACIMSTFLDITERKQAEEDLRRSNGELEQFAYVASHDLQEPLRAVAGMVQLLQQRYKGQLDERADEYIFYAVEAASRMQSLINDLLAYSRVDRRGKPLEAVNMQLTLETALSNLQVALRESAAEVMHDELPTVLADPTQLLQLLQNLISNAIKFREERALQIRINVTKSADFYQFSVCDNGIGIEEQYFERIFQVFQRLHTRREYPGTGIGLALCKKIIERHGGHIWVESEPGQGSKFFFTLPVPGKSV